MTEKLVLSVGLSVSVVMFFGLFINWLYPLFGYDTPLATNSLLVSISILTLLLTAIAYLRNQPYPFIQSSDFKLDLREKSFLIIPFSFPFLGIMGMRLMNATDNNIVLMALFVVIPAYFTFISIKHKQVSESVYPPMILSTAVCLTLLLALRSTHIIGIDTNTEYYFFQQTFHNGHWQSIMDHPFDSCLSISILPTVYQAFMHMDSEYLFKIFYPLIFSFSPLVVYLIAKKYLSSFYASLASLFFMAQNVFLMTSASSRTTIAILFFALSVMVLFHEGLSDFAKKLLFIIFVASCLVSHYSTSYILLAVLLLTWLGISVVSRIILFRTKTSGSIQPDLNLDHNLDSLKDDTDALETITRQSLLPTYVLKKVTLSTLLVVLALLFFWYAQINEVVFKVGIDQIHNTQKSVVEFADAQSRGYGTAAALGIGIGSKDAPQILEFVFSWLTIALLVIGVLISCINYRKANGFSASPNPSSSGTSSKKLDVQFLTLILACSAVLATGVVFPYVFQNYAEDRTYCQVLTVLASFFVIGAMRTAGFLRIKWRYIVVLIALIPYFMSTTGMIYQIFNFPRSMILNSAGQDYNIKYIHEQESSAAHWLKAESSPTDLIFTDYLGGTRLISQGEIPSPVYYTIMIDLHREVNYGYIYLRYFDVTTGVLLDHNVKEQNLTNYQSSFAKRILIYDNGGSEVWR
ncbi:MAG: DUF2206 domain-containing protein [Dehalococcoidia bacterium]|nr:DUF2206 domain-containing protein [Dehalococcoidia bacterium]